MTLLVLKGPRTSVEDLEGLTVVEPQNLDHFLSKISEIADPKEIFIQAHGAKPVNQGWLSKIFRQPSSLYLSLFFDDTTITDKNILSFIKLSSRLSSIKNSSVDDPINIIHIVSCFSGAAHKCLNKIEGNIVLCTYAEAEQSSIVRMAPQFILDRKKSNSLIEYIVNNLHLCAAVGFEINCKIDKKTYHYKIKSNTIRSIKNTDEAQAFLQKELKRLELFYNNLQQKCHKKYPEVFIKYEFSEKDKFDTKELNRMLNRCLFLAVTNDDINGSTDLLSYEQINVMSDILCKAVENTNSNLLELLLKHPTAKVNLCNINLATKIKDSRKLELLLNHPTAKVDYFNINTATAINDRKVIELLLGHPSTKIHDNNVQRLRTAMAALPQPDSGSTDGNTNSPLALSLQTPTAAASRPSGTKSDSLDAPSRTVGI